LLKIFLFGAVGFSNSLIFIPLSYGVPYPVFMAGVPTLAVWPFSQRSFSV